jgi:DNA gyrase/topoisomerase IV subunit B
MSKINKEYTANDIQILSDRDHVRLRLSMYGGSTSPTQFNLPYFKSDKIEITQTTFVPAVLRMFQEIVDNSNDEFSQLTKTDKTLTITYSADNGIYSVEDNGRGVPIETHSSGKPTPEVVFASLRSGRNFATGKEAGTQGQNGIGSSMVAFCSEKFDIEIVRDGKKYTQTFSDGAAKITEPVIKKHAASKSGTKISYTLDNTVVVDTSLPTELLRNKSIEIAFNNPGTVVSYNNEKFQYKNGLEDIVKGISKQYFKFGISGFEFFVILDQYEGMDEQVFTWVNSSLLYDGGMCNTQFVNAFVDATTEHLKKEAKKLGAEITKNDIRQNLLILGSLKVSDPVYDSQSKTRLIGPNLRKELDGIIAAGWTLFAKRNREWLDSVLEKANERHHKNANKKASDEFKKTLRKKVPGLLDATERDRSKCSIFVTEGLSAASSLVEVRTPATMGSFPLGGKINNVYGSTVAQVLKMGKLTDLLAAVGLVPGQKAYKHELRFGKRVVIATDSDPDGDDIITTLLCLFYQFWPELFDPKQPSYFYRLIAPNVVAVKGNKRVHFKNRPEYVAQRDKYKGWTIQYYKGLGSMERSDWEMIINDDRFYLPITGDAHMKEVMHLLFSDDSDARKVWLSTTEDTLT